LKNDFAALLVFAGLVNIILSGLARTTLWSYDNDWNLKNIFIVLWLIVSVIVFLVGFFHLSEE